MLTKAQSTYGTPLNVMGLALEYLCTIQDRPSIIQIGAHDGVRADPVQGVIRARNLPALLVEPLPDMAAMLRKQHSDVPSVTIEEAAIGEKSGALALYRIDPAAHGLPAWVQELASFDKSVILKHSGDDGMDRRAFAAAVIEVPVRVMTFSQLMEKYPAFCAADILQVDTEGHDRIIVEAAIEAGLRPKLINYEHKHLSLPDQERCRRFLSERGYSFASNASDTQAILF